MDFFEYEGYDKAKKVQALDANHVQEFANAQDQKDANLPTVKLPPMGIESIIQNKQKRGIPNPNSRKMTPLKKKDGEALWRKDIQYDFLDAIFSDENRVFTNRYNEYQLDTFAKVYLDSMAHSTKCSKVLSDRLTGDRKVGVKIAMVCLLVNLGRINTTLNFFPEMKGLLRTYHPIPSLQTLDTQDYKQLQDAPRLKSILKGSWDGTRNLMAVEKLPPGSRISPIHLIFLMSATPHVVESVFMSESSAGFFDLILDTSKTSKSRAKAFLWLVHQQLETSPEVPNPFGPTFPELEPVPPGKACEENVDTPWETAFATKMSLQRIAILEGYNSAPTVTNVAQKKNNFFTLTVPRQRTRSAKDRRVLDCYNEILHEKRQKRRLRRREAGNPIGSLWRRIKSIDPVYDSDDDVEKMTMKQRSVDICPGALAAGICTSFNDYGERSLATSIALKRTAKQISPTP